MGGCSFQTGSGFSRTPISKVTSYRIFGTSRLYFKWPAESRHGDCCDGGDEIDPEAGISDENSCTRIVRMSQLDRAQGAPRWQHANVHPGYRGALFINRGPRTSS